MTTQLNGIDELATKLLNDIEDNQPVHIDVIARDVASGSLLMLLLAIHEVAKRRNLSVVVSHVADDAIRISLPSAS